MRARASSVHAVVPPVRHVVRRSAPVLPVVRLPRRQGRGQPRRSAHRARRCRAGTSSSSSSASAGWGASTAPSRRTSGAPSRSRSSTRTWSARRTPRRASSPRPAPRAASNHPNSVGIIDFGKTPDGQLYLVMEFLRGRDLARVTYEDGALPFRRIVDVLRQTLAALARGAQREHHPPGPQAREHHPRARALGRRLREGRRLRPRQDARRDARSPASPAPASSAARPST